MRASGSTPSTSQPAAWNSRATMPVPQPTSSTRRPGLAATMRPLSELFRARRRKDGFVPTGIALRDVREQLFDAAERVLLRDGAAALTSRAVTTEAGVAKGVLHRHFADFDAFLAELVLDRAGR